MMQDEDILKSIGLEGNITQESDLKGVMKELNQDTLEKETGFASIDMRSRITPFEALNINIHDSVVMLDCLPRICLNTTRIKKRLAVSIGGLGRKEMVSIVRSERDHQEQKQGLFSRLMGGGSNGS